MRLELAPAGSRRAGLSVGEQCWACWYTCCGQCAESPSGLTGFAKPAMICKHDCNDHKGEQKRPPKNRKWGCLYLNPKLPKPKSLPKPKASFFLRLPQLLTLMKWKKKPQSWVFVAANVNKRAGDTEGGNWCLPNVPHGSHHQDQSLAECK